MLVDYTYYSGTFMGTIVPSTSWASFEAVAERVINLHTRGAVTEQASLSATDLDSLKMAVCAQADYYGISGLYTAVNGVDNSSYTVGSVHVTGKYANDNSADPGVIGKEAQAILEQTGLLSRQVADPRLIEMPWR